jgi:Na+/proline symporter
MIVILKSILAIFASTYAVAFSVDFFKNKDKLSKASWPGLLGTGFVTNFLDTLGIGSFAQQTALLKFFNLVDDRIIPGTLNVGNTMPTVCQAFIFMTVIKVAPLTLTCMAIAAPVGLLPCRNYICFSINKIYDFR